MSKELIDRQMTKDEVIAHRGEQISVLEQQIAEVNFRNERLVADYAEVGKQLASQAEQIKELALADNKMIADLSEYVEVLEDQIAKQAEQAAVLLAYLGNLLALIHRDGGQHQTEVGTEQAVKDAEDVWLSLRESHDAQAAQIARLREMVK